MTQDHISISRRIFLAMTAAVPLAMRAGTGSAIPIGLELYSVRNELSKNLTGTLQAVAKLGYQCVEFYAPYYAWTADYARAVRKQLDDLGVRCYSTHNDFTPFGPEGPGKAIALNQILGSRYVVLAHPGRVSALDGWKRVAESLSRANDAMARQGLHAGYHNHQEEWKPVEGQRPMDVLAAGTEPSVMLQLDVGTCLEAHGDPVAWIEKNPGRIRSLHLKDWSPERGYRVPFGEGVAPWPKIMDAAESRGGAEYYLIEQEGSDYSELETARRCLAAYRKVREA